jgi:hypothetical protein
MEQDPYFSALIGCGPLFGSYREVTMTATEDAYRFEFA